MTKERNNVARAAIVVMAASVVGKVLAFGREMVIANYFGASSSVDAYLVACILPVFISSVIGGAICAILIPIFTDLYAQKKHPEMEELTGVLFFIFSVVFLGITGVLLLGASGVIRILAPGFDVEQRQLAVYLLRIMAPGMWLFVVRSLFVAILNTKRRFFIAALPPAVLNGVIMVGVAVSYQYWGINGLALATLVGSAVQVVVLWVALRRVGFRVRPVANWQHPMLRQVFRLMGPVFLVSAIFQINVMIDRMIGTTLPEGSIAALNYAYRLMYLPQGLIVVGIVTAMYPSISEFAYRKDFSQFKKSFMTGIEVISSITVPAATGLMVLGHPIVKLVFQRGAFDAAASENTVAALFFYSLGIAAYSMNDLLTRAFFALKDTKTPLKIGLVVAGLNIILNLILVRFFMHAGLALATSVVGFVNTLVGLYLLRKKIGPFGGRYFVGRLARILAASGIMALLAGAFYRYLSLLLVPFGSNGLGEVICMGSTIGFAIVVYLVAMYLFGLRDVFIIVLSLVRRK